MENEQKPVKLNLFKINKSEENPVSDVPELSNNQKKELKEKLSKLLAQNAYEAASIIKTATSTANEAVLPLHSITKRLRETQKLFVDSKSPWASFAGKSFLEEKKSATALEKAIADFDKKNDFLKKLNASVNPPSFSKLMEISEYEKQPPVEIPVIPLPTTTQRFADDEVIEGLSSINEVMVSLKDHFVHGQENNKQQTFLLKTLAENSEAQMKANVEDKKERLVFERESIKIAKWNLWLVVAGLMIPSLISVGIYVHSQSQAVRIVEPIEVQLPREELGALREQLAIIAEELRRIRELNIPKKNLKKETKKDSN